MSFWREEGVFWDGCVFVSSCVVTLFPINLFDISFELSVLASTSCDNDFHSVLLIVWESNSWSLFKNCHLIEWNNNFPNSSAIHHFHIIHDFTVFIKKICSVFSLPGYTLTVCLITCHKALYICYYPFKFHVSWSWRRGSLNGPS